MSRFTHPACFGLYCVPQEFYDYRNDPCALTSLVDDPQYQDEVRKLRRQMLEIMRSIDDPLLEKLRKVDRR